MAKSLSAVTKLKIARSLKGNKNAFKGGPKARLSTRQKIANINAATKAKKANLSTDQIARRQAVAKRLRAQARREEALGGGNPGTMKTNADELSATFAKSDRLKAGGLEAMRTAKSADDIRAATAKIKEARNALKEGAPRSSRKESAAKVQPSAKQNLNAPQTPPEQRSAALSPAQRRRQQRSSFEANEAKARLAENQLVDKLISAGRQNEDREIAEFKANRQAGQASEFARQRGAQVVDVPISGRGSRGGGRRKDPFNNHYDKAEKKVVDRIDDLKREISQMEAHRGSNSLPGPAEKRARNALETARGRLSRLRFERSQNNTPKPPQSDTGTDRSGTFTKKVPVKGEKSTRSNGRKAIETEEDLQDLIAEKTPDIIRKLAKGIPQSDLRDLKAMIGKEMGAEGLDALNDILKG